MMARAIDMNSVMTRSDKGRCDRRGQRWLKHGAAPTLGWCGAKSEPNPTWSRCGEVMGFIKSNTGLNYRHGLF